MTNAFFPPSGRGPPAPLGAGLPATIGNLPAVGEPLSAGVGVDLSVAEIWRVLAKWRWLILSATALGLVLAIGATLLMTPIYRATVTMEIAKQPVQIVNMGSVQPDDGGDGYMATQLGIMQSRSLAQRVAQQMNLASDAKIVSQSLPRDTRERRATSAAQRGFAAEPVKFSRLVKMSFSSADPKVAARIANGYADNYIASNLERRYQTTAYARDFLQKRIGVIRGRLEKSERDLYDYARREGIVLVGGNEGSEGAGAQGNSLVSSTLVSLNNALSSAQDQRISAELRYRQALQAGSTSDLVGNSGVQNLISQRADLQSQYDEQLTTFKPEYPAMVRLRARIDALNGAITAQKRFVTQGLGGDYRAALARERALTAQVAQLKGSVLDLRGRSINYTILAREVDTNRTLYDGLLQRFKEVGVAAGIGEDMMSIVDRAQAPGSPISPNLMLNIVIGVVVGLVLGIAVALGIEFVDDTIATPEDLEQKLKLTSLGVIPIAAKGTSFLEQVADTKSAVSEAYFSVRTQLQFSTEKGIPSSILITSSRPGEGKSSSSLALAQNLARGGAQVLLIEADLRKPTFRTPGHEGFGLANLLTGDDHVERAIYKTTSNGLFIMTSGPVPPNPAELINGHRMRELLSRLADTFDTVVIDGPPVLGLADAPILASMADATILIVESGGIRRPIAVGAVNRLRAANAHLIGGILTKFSERFGAAGYGYGYGYGGEAYSYGNREPGKMIELAVVQ